MRRLEGGGEKGGVSDVGSSTGLYGTADSLIFRMIQRIKNNGNILGPRMDIIVSNAKPRATRVT